MEDIDAVAWDLVTRAQSARAGGQIKEADSCLTSANDRFEKTNNLEGLGVVAHQRANLLADTGDLPGAEEYLETAIARFKATDSNSGLGHVAYLRGDISRRKGDSEGAERDYLDAQSYYSLGNNQLGIGNASRALAEVLVQLGDFERARMMSDKAISVMSAISDIQGLAAAQRIRAFIARRLDEPDVAQRLETATVLTASVGDHSGLAALSVERSRLAVSRGLAADGVQALRDAITIYSSIGDRLQYLTTSMELTELLFNSGHPTDALSQLDDMNRRSVTAIAPHLRSRIERVSGLAFRQLVETAEAAIQSGDDRAAVGALAKLGFAQVDSGATAEGGLTLARSAQVSLRLGDSSFAANAFGLAGNALASAGALEEAAEALRSAALLFSELEAPSRALVMWRDLAEVSAKLAAWGDAREQLAEARKWAAGLADSETLGQLWMAESDADLWTGHLDRAVSAATEARELFSHAESPISEASAIRSLGQLQWARGDSRLGEELCKEALSTYEELDSPIGIGNVHITLADIASGRGDSDAQYSHLVTAFSNYQRAGDRPGLAIAAHRLAAHEDDLEVALKLEDFARSTYEELSDILGQANVARAVGERLRESNSQKAREALESAYAMFQRIGHNAGLAVTGRQLAEIALHERDYSAAEELLLVALNASELSDSKSESAHIHTRLGTVYLSRDDIEGTIRAHQIALTIYLDLGDVEGLSRVGLLLPGWLRRQNRPQEALAVLEQILEALHDGARWIDSWASRLDHHRWESELRTVALGLAAELSEGERAGGIIEAATGTLLPGLRKILSAREPIGGRLVEIDRLAANLAALEVAEMPKDPMLTQQFFRRRILERERIIGQMGEIVGQDMRRLVGRGTEPYSLMVEQVMAAGVAVLQIHLSAGIRREQYFDIVWTQPGESARHVRSPLSEESRRALDVMLAIQHDPTAAELQNFQNALDSGIDDQDLAALAAQLLPLEFINSAPEQILIVPGPLLWNLPWSAMPIGHASVDRASRLVNSTAVSLTPALRLMNNIDPAGSPLPMHAWLSNVEGIELERRTLQAVFGTGVTIERDSGALLDRMAPEAVQVGTVIISVHGQLENGLRHGIVLEPGVELTAAHLLGWNMPRTLILGACWAARLDPDPLGDQLALATLALAKGASNIVGAVYPLPDESHELAESPTALLMSALYEELATKTPALALRAAQLRYSHLPSHLWAGLIHIAGSAGG